MRNSLPMCVVLAAAALVVVVANASTSPPPQHGFTTPLTAWEITSATFPAPDNVVTAPCTVVGGLLENGYYNQEYIFAATAVDGDGVASSLSEHVAAVDPASPATFNPFYGKNLQALKKSDYEVPFTFKTIISLPPNGFFAAAADVASAEPPVVLLHFHGLNYRASIAINQQDVTPASAEGPLAVPMAGALQEIILDITSIVQQQQQQRESSSISPADSTTSLVLEVTLTPQDHSPGEWRSFNTNLGINFQDWNPHPPDLSMGLWLPVELHVLPPTAPLLVLGVATQLDASLQWVSVCVDIQTFSSTAGLGPNGFDFIVNVYPLGATDFNATAPVMSLGQISVAAGALQPFTAATLCTPQVVPFTLGTDALWAPFGSNGNNNNNNNNDGFANRFTVAVFLQQQQTQQEEQYKQQTASLSVETSTAPPSLLCVYNSTIGFRHVAADFTPGGALKVMVNGEYHQIRGAGWNPDMFLRMNDRARVESELKLVRDMGLNAIRLEGMVMNQDFYDLTDAYGIMVLPGFACCDGWQNWSFWPPENTPIARASAAHQARRVGRHPSVVAFFLSSDDLPPEEIERLYTDTFRNTGFSGILISSASQEVSNISGNPGVKMVGPYSWVPPNYWLQDGDGDAGNYGGAWGFLTEGGPGESPMTYASWQRTVPAEYLWNASTDEPMGPTLDSWWSWHMGNPNGYFRNLTYYTPALYARYGPAPTSADQYLTRAQAANFEAIRSYMESYRRNTDVNATGFVQWMLNSAWPSHLWTLYDYYLVAGGSYYGARAALARNHYMMSYNDGSIWGLFDLPNDPNGYNVATGVHVSVMSLNGTTVWSRSDVSSVGATGIFSLAKVGLQVPIDGKPFFNSPGETFLVRVAALPPNPSPTSSSSLWEVPAPSWYWLSTTPDILDWNNSNGFRTPSLQYADFSDIFKSIQQSGFSEDVSIRPVAGPKGGRKASRQYFSLQNTDNNGKLVFGLQLRAVLVNNPQIDIAGVRFSDNFVTLLPQETLLFWVDFDGSFSSPTGAAGPPVSPDAFGAQWTIVPKFMQ